MKKILILLINISLISNIFSLEIKTKDLETQRVLETLVEIRNELSNRASKSAYGKEFNKLTPEEIIDSNFVEAFNEVTKSHLLNPMAKAPSVESYFHLKDESLKRKPAFIFTLVTTAMAALGIYWLINDISDLSKEYKSLPEDKGSFGEFLSYNKGKVALIGVESLLIFTPAIGAAIKVGIHTPQAISKVVVGTQKVYGIKSASAGSVSASRVSKGEFRDYAKFYQVVVGSKIKKSIGQRLAWAEGAIGPRYFSSVENAFKHYLKHRKEFPEFKNAVEYVRYAHKFMKNPPKGTLIGISSKKIKILSFIMKNLIFLQ